MFLSPASRIRRRTGCRAVFLIVHSLGHDLRFGRRCETNVLHLVEGLLLLHIYKQTH